MDVCDEEKRGVGFRQRLSVLCREIDFQREVSWRECQGTYGDVAIIVVKVLPTSNVAKKKWPSCLAKQQ